MADAIRDMVRDMVQSIVRETVADAVRAELGNVADIMEPTMERSNRSTRATNGVATDGRNGPRVGYWLTKKGTKAGVGDDLTANNAKVFKVVSKRGGLSKREIAGKIGVAPHSTESNINQLQQLGLIESRPYKG